MKKSHSNSSSRSAFRVIYFLPVVAFTLFFVYYLIGSDRNENPVKSQTIITPDSPSVIQKPHREIEQKVLSVPEPEQKVLPVPESEQVSEEQVSAQNDYTGPLKELTPTDAQSQLLYEAEEVLVQTCMNERGFEYRTNSFVDENEQEKRESSLPKPGDVEAARTRGYGIVESIGIGVPPNADSDVSINSDKKVETINTDKMDSQDDPNSDLLANMSPEQQQAWNETFFGRMDNPVEIPDAEGSIIAVELPSGGEIRWDSNSCLSNARREIYGNSMKQMENLIATQALVNNIATAARQDAEYQGVLAQWRSCMLSHDLPYQYPEEAAATLQREYSEGKLDIVELQKKEIHYASIEAACLQQYPVGDAYKTSEHRAEAKFRETDGDQINYLHAELQNALINAERYAPHPDEDRLR